MRLLRYFFFIVLLFSFSAGLHADERRQYTISQVAAQLKSSGAEILSAEIQEGTRQGIVYRFKIKKQGRIRVVFMRPDGTQVR